MCRKLFLLILPVVVLGLVSGALGANKVWMNTTGDSDWCTGDNWNPDGEPVSGDTAYIDQITKTSPDRGPIVFTGCAAVCSTIDGPNPADDHTQVMDVNGTGSVTAGMWEWIVGTGTAIINISDDASVTTTTGHFRGTDEGVSILNISGNPQINLDSGLRGADKTGEFYVNMSGGYLECQWLVIGDNGGGELNISNGTFVTRGPMDLGGIRGSAPITVNMTGGLVKVRGEVRCPGGASRGGAIRINLKGGIFDCNELLHGGSFSEDPTYTDDWRIDIEQGLLEIRGDVRAAIDVNVAAGQITAYDGEGEVVVELIGPNTVVTGLSPDPNIATKPEPRNHAQNVDPNGLLRWTAGINASSHDVYLGTSWQDVNDAITLDAVYQDNVGPNEFDPCGLEMETMYYWRIDEVNSAHADSPWKGNVWRFTSQSPIIDPHMRVWYKLDEPNGFLANDASGYGNHGPVDGPEDLWLPDGGRDGGARQFDEDGEEATVIDVPPSALADVTDGVTVIVWLKDTYSRTNEDNYVFNAGKGGENGPCHLYGNVVSAEKDLVFRAGDDACDVLEVGVSPVQGWHHYAFVKDEVKDEMCVYIDSELVGSKTGVGDTLQNIQGSAFKVGSATWSANYDYVGKMDNFKFFDYGMSAKEVAADYRGGDVTKAWAPSPGDYEMDVPRDANLAWKAGDYAVKHAVYFGTAWDDVNDAGTNDAEYKGEFDPCEWNPPGVLELDTTYYWRIDEVNDSNVDSPWKGDVWQFTVANFLLIDDMETYNNTGRRIYYTWDDGYANGSGSEVGLGIKPLDVAHGGQQSMEYLYDNHDGKGWDLDYYSEASRSITDPCDWTQVGIKILTLFFYGRPGNDANATEQMYVGVEDGAGVYAQLYYGCYGEDMNDIKEKEWHQWDLSLPDLAGVDMNDVATLYIGFGIRGNPNPGGTPGGEGIVYFDDIRLYPAKCIPWRLKPQGDFTDDCTVDIRDVAQMGERWLKRDLYFDEYTDPGTVGLVGWWKLNEDDGSIANDSSPSGTHDGTISGDYEWVEGYDSNSAVEFSGGRVLVPDACELKPPATVSVTAWIYYSGDPGGSSRMVVKGKNDYEAYCLEADSDDSMTFYVGDVNGERYFADSCEGDIYPDDWIHLAGTYDGTISKLYINGEVVATNDEANSIPLSQDPCGLAIGNKADVNDSGFKGSIDDVRVYNRALTAAEVAYLASNGTGFVELNLEENLYEGETPEVINFRDLDVLLDSWLEETLWPADETIIGAGFAFDGEDTVGPARVLFLYDNTNAGLLEPNDIIVEYRGIPVSTGAELLSVIDSLEDVSPGTTIAIKIKRGAVESVVDVLCIRIRIRIVIKACADSYWCAKLVYTPGPGHTCRCIGGPPNCDCVEVQSRMSGRIRGIRKRWIWVLVACWDDCVPPHSCIASRFFWGK